MKRRRTRSRRRTWKLSPQVRTLIVGALVSLLMLAALVSGQRRPTPNLAARVLFSETAGCSHRERLLVAGVMRNRIGNPPFGNAATLYDVVAQPGAFSCINDPDNANWRKTRDPDLLTRAERSVWEDCQGIVQHPIPRAVGPSGRLLVYYHDHSISKPASWDNARFHAVREISTEHFVFYSIVPAPGRP
jgi:hypothetical protein